jgi:hypothetical protein
VSDGIKLAPCPNCLTRGWIDDGFGDWIRCSMCNPPPPSAQVLEFVRGAKVRNPKKPVDDLPPAA